jgi:23S rRNA (uracil1939-C5)-methyltransferase/tRNA (uracil-5-)-methyltransferase
LELVIYTLTFLVVGLGRVPLPAAGGQPAVDSGLRSQVSGFSSNWVVMVPFTLPGEKVRARVFRNHKNFSEADLVEVLTPSPHRIDPKCPLFGRCGGCQYQHLTYAEQLKWKRQQVEELLKYMAGVEFPVNPVIGSPREFGSGSKNTPLFHVRNHGGPGSPPAADGRVADPPVDPTPIGFLKQGTRFDLLDVPQCPIATPEINAKLPEVRARTRARLAAGEYKRDATLLLRHAQEGVITEYDAVIHEKVGDLRLHFLSRDFFQNNPFILPVFTGYARDQAAASGAKFLVDAYCGSGLFALTCAPAFQRVAGIEISESSIKFATENAAANGITNATFRAGDAAQIFAGLDFPPTDTAVLIDPPRKGCDESFLNQLFAFGPRAVVYVSCDPATQMRDLKSFVAAGYQLTAVQPFDLFPQTRHLECVITLRKE